MYIRTILQASIIIAASIIAGLGCQKSTESSIEPKQSAPKPRVMGLAPGDHESNLAEAPWSSTCTRLDDEYNITYYRCIQPTETAHSVDLSYLDSVLVSIGIDFYNETAPRWGLNSDATD